jgi:hypothetical protein
MPNTLAAHTLLDSRFFPANLLSTPSRLLPVYSPYSPPILPVNSSSTSSLPPAFFLPAAQQFNSRCSSQPPSTPLAPFPRYLSCPLPQLPKR